MGSARGIVNRQYGGGQAIADEPAETPSVRVGGGVASSITGQAQSGISDITQGRLSLAALEVIAVGLLLFYVWTRNVQGGG